MEVLSLSLFLFLSPPGKNRKREREANRTVTVELGRGLVLQNNPGRVCVFFLEFTWSVIFSAVYLVVCYIFSSFDNFLLIAGDLSSLRKSESENIWLLLTSWWFQFIQGKSPLLSSQSTTPVADVLKGVAVSSSNLSSNSITDGMKPRWHWWNGWTPLSGASPCWCSGL